jgi:hypothetical protein
MADSDQRGEEAEVVGSLESGYWGYWALAENGIYHLDTASTPGINFFDLTTRRSTRVLDFEKHPPEKQPGSLFLRMAKQFSTHSWTHSVGTLSW